VRRLFTRARAPQRQKLTAVVYAVVFAVARYLSTLVSDSLAPDIARFICGVFHPSNKLIQSSVVPRWAVLGHFFTTWYACIALHLSVPLCRFLLPYSCAVAAGADVPPRCRCRRWSCAVAVCCLCSHSTESTAATRQAVLFDWLGFDGTPSIMLVEPSLLLMQRSLPKFHEMTSSLLAMLLDLVNTYDVYCAFAEACVRALRACVCVCACAACVCACA
jgi:hypothetical protein